jgi:hypothetical protein
MDTPAPPTDPSPPRFRLRVAVLLVLLTWPLGWPMVAASASASAWIGARPAAMLGTASYVGSWLLFAVATWLGGAELAALRRSGWWRR